jgi:hypothetical protein
MLTSESEIVLHSITRKLHAQPNLMTDVRGYTDNGGSPAVNTVLSKKMADQVRDYLTGRLGLSHERIQTFGYGAKNPVSSNNTHEDRRKNRRVEILIRTPDAVLTWFENDVRVQPPSLRPHWLNPTPNYYLYHDYRVATGKKSSAHILYPNNGTLQMSEEAMVIIQGLNVEQKEEDCIKNLELQDGGLTAILEDVARQDDSIPNGPVTVGEPNAQSGTTHIDDKLESLIVAYHNDTGVSAGSAHTGANQTDSVAVTQNTDRGRPTGFALGIIVGKPTGITLKTDISKKHTFDFRIGWALPGERFHVACDYISYFPKWIEREKWYPYLGIGSRLTMKQEEDTLQFNLGIRVGIGVEHVYRELGLFAELYPVVELVPETGLSLEGGIGVRYYFRD